MTGSRIGKAIAAKLGGAPVGTAADDGYWHCFDCGAEGRVGASQSDAAAALNAHRQRVHGGTDA